MTADKQEEKKQSEGKINWAELSDSRRVIALFMPNEMPVCIGLIVKSAVLLTEVSLRLGFL